MRLGIIGGMDDIPAESKFVKYAEMVGGCYGSGEYTVDSDELMKVSPDVTNRILVAGGIVNPGGVNEPQTASTVEVELRDLFKSVSFRKNIKQKPAKESAKKPRNVRNVRNVHKRGGNEYSDGTKMSDVFSTLYFGSQDTANVGETLLSIGGSDDYSIAEGLSEDVLGGAGSDDDADVSSDVDISSDVNVDISGVVNVDISSDDEKANVHIGSAGDNIADIVDDTTEFDIRSAIVN